MIIGSNGAGKTTLFRSDAWALPPSSGAVRFHGVRHCRDACTADRPSRISFVPAERRLFPRMSVQENLLGAYPGRPDPGTVELVMGLFLVWPSEKISTPAR